MQRRKEPVYTRRAFVRTLGIGGAGIFAVRREALGRMWSPEGPVAAAERAIPLHNNENPLGPGKAALDAVRAALGEGGLAGRYPYGPIDDLRKAIAERYGAKPENVLVGCGSTQILRTAVQVFTSPSRPLLGGYPTYEECAEYADLIGTPVRTVQVDRGMKLDLMAMADAAKDAGVVFLNNPNNPTATVLSAEAVGAFIDKVLTLSADTTILIDEAYHDYVIDPAYRSEIPTALKSPRVIVARTFSKAHGMAGMRVGYALGHAETIKKLAAWEETGSLNVAGVVAAMASIQDPARISEERKRNTQAREFTLDWFRRAGFQGTDSQTNFIFVNTGRPAKEFREACLEEGVRVGRDFPPFEKTHARISIATLDEMKRACAVFGRVLGVKAKAAA